MNSLPWCYIMYTILCLCSCYRNCSLRSAQSWLCVGGNHTSQFLQELSSYYYYYSTHFLDRYSSQSFHTTYTCHMSKWPASLGIVCYYFVESFAARFLRNINFYAQFFPIEMNGEGDVIHMRTVKLQHWSALHTWCGQLYGLSRQDRK